VVAGATNGQAPLFVPVTPVTQAALSGSSATWLHRICQTVRQSGPAKQAERGTGLTAFATARSPRASAWNTGPLSCTMRTSGVGRREPGTSVIELPGGPLDVQDVVPSALMTAKPV
jgi:hypothetical protein